MSLDLHNKHVLVLGLGDTGLSVLRWLHGKVACLRVADTRGMPPGLDALRAELPEVAVHLGNFEHQLFREVDLIVTSPGVAMAEPEIQAALASGIPVVGDIELFARAIDGSHAKVIAITGSNGKSTVTSLVGHLCSAAGLDTVVAGNIGLPVLDALAEREMTGKAPQVWVLELSSFQLETTSNLKADAATVLNISADHMDRYATLGEYAAAKERIFHGCRVQILNRDDAIVMAMVQPPMELQTFGLNAGNRAAEWGVLEREGRRWLARGNERLFPVDELPIAGLHNAANSLAALALCRAIGLKYEPMLAALRTFKGLPHRVEFVAEVSGRVFYDDSKGTNVGATAAALKGFDAPVVLIAGGDGKGQDFSPLREAVKNARAVVQIGRDGPLVAAAIAGACPVHRAESMEEAVNMAYVLSQPGDAVLLSPACASWDMFRNYGHRADAFIAAVHALGVRSCTC
jgi:UDP-N-acetylmuramoylalanine--D-glutamate ligase